MTFQRFLSKNGEEIVEQRMRKESTTADQLCHNFQLLLGANKKIENIKNAIEEVAGRDYRELDLEQIPPIFVPLVFLSRCPESIDNEKYVEMLNGLEDKLTKDGIKELKELKYIKEVQEKLASTSTSGVF